jgi:ATP-dependent phosphoenolpyruvate carboxykinase
MLLMTSLFDLEDQGVTVAEIHRNLPPSALYEHVIRHEKDASIAENGALVAYSRVKTGRSPKDKRVVRHPDSEADHVVRNSGSARGSRDGVSRLCVSSGHVDD